MVLFNRWHSWLDMPKNDRAWHEKDIADEVAELEKAKGMIATWSELSDVVYTVTRARWSGYTMPFPLKKREVFFGALYMFPKYTSRWLFFRTLGKGFGKKLHMVRNPAKTEKLRALADMSGINPDDFIVKAKSLLRCWPLLP